MTAAAWLAVVPFACWAAIRVGGERDALVPIFAFTPYVAPVAVVAAAAVSLARRWAAATVGGLAALALAGAVVPRALPGPRPDDPGGPRVRVLTANVYYGLADIDALHEAVLPDGGRP